MDLTMDAVSLIEKKKEGERLSPEEVSWIVDGYVEGKLPDYQVSAFLMAVCLKGMEEEETVALTRAMLRSGKKLEPSAGAAVVDKHSTGGVGDKVSIALAPLGASLGLRIPMLSGRTLGHTGGTLDKLESIPGYRSLLSIAEMGRLLDDVGCFISGQTEEMAPADRKLYALRDTTATVDSIPLITASILSKKLSEGIDALIMDVKFGLGAFMRTSREARALARSLVTTGAELGLEVRVLFTRMEEPLGRAVGNALEVIEAVRLLEGSGPVDLEKVTLALAAEMVVAGGLSTTRKEALASARKALRSGTALEKLELWIQSQGGRLDFARGDLGLELAPLRRPIPSESEGFVSMIDAKRIGLAVVALRGGRTRMSDKIDHRTGLVMEKKVGDRVERAEPLAVVHAPDETTLDRAISIARGAFTISGSPPRKARLIQRS